MSDERHPGAIKRALIALGLLLCCAAVTPAEAHEAHHKIAHHYQHTGRSHRHRHKVRAHRHHPYHITVADFARGLAAAKPIITIPATPGSPEIVVFGREVDEPSGGIGLLADVGTTVDFGSERTSSGAREVYHLVAESAREIGAPVAEAIAITHLESGGSCNKIGGVGERGPMQIRPQTAWAMGLRPHSCAEWIDASVRYLKTAVEMHGRGCGGASAYNLGTYTRGTYCSGYGRAVMALARGAPTLRAALIEARWSPRIHHHHHRRHLRAWTFSDSPPLSPA